MDRYADDVVALLDQLKNDDPEVRLQAAQGLRQIGLRHRPADDGVQHAVTCLQPANARDLSRRRAGTSAVRRGGLPVVTQSRGT